MKTDLLREYWCGSNVTGASEPSAVPGSDTSCLPGISRAKFDLRDHQNVVKVVVPLTGMATRYLRRQRSAASGSGGPTYPPLSQSGLWADRKF